jgi:tetratricopeptide (TPR) repeat protein
VFWGSHDPSYTYFAHVFSLMLYDILPPLFLLASFGGITVILSRVVMRVQQQRLSQEMKAHASATRALDTEDLFRSRGAKVSVVKNRLALIPQAAGSVFQSVRGIKARRQERKLQKAAMRETQERMASQMKSATPAPSAASQPGNVVAQPTPSRFSRLTSGVASVAQRGRERLQQVRARRQALSEEPAAETSSESDHEKKVAATVRRVMGGSVASESATGGVSAMLRRKKVADQDPLSRAATCLKQSQYDKAEDILLPYIIRHARDTKAYMLLGRAALGRSDWAEAIEIFQQVKAIDENVPGLFASLGRAAVKAGRMTLAIETLQKARDAEPTNIVIREQLLTIAKHTDNKVLEKIGFGGTTRTSRGEDSPPRPTSVITPKSASAFSVGPVGALVVTPATAGLSIGTNDTASGLIRDVSS